MSAEIQDILKRYLEDYCKKHSLTVHQHKVLMDIVNCRTAALGGHVDECDKCGHIEVSYNSCKNRHCPKCQMLKKAKWIDARKEDLLPVPYFHVVFTIPEQLNMIMYQNQEEMYKILFEAVSGTLTELAADSKHLGAQIGFTAILHTWGQNLMYHPHLHCIVAAGGVAEDGSFKMSKEDFFIHIKVLSQKFRGKFIHMLKKAYECGKLKFHGSTAEFNNEQIFFSLINTLYKKKWVVYSKKTFSGPEAVIEYLGRYTHRVAISNNRILSIKDGKVTFKWRDYRDNNTEKIMTITAEEFIRRFVMHILPKKFVKIRHFGLLANRNKTIKLRKLQANMSFKIKSQFKDMKTVEIINLIIGRDVTRCPCCGKGTMKTIRIIPAAGFLP
jgi:hypothetical protein